MTGYAFPNIGTREDDGSVPRYALPPPYSLRRAASGCTWATRRAGSQAAPRPAAGRTITTVADVAGPTRRLLLHGVDARRSGRRRLHEFRFALWRYRRRAADHGLLPDQGCSTNWTTNSSELYLVW